MEKVEKNSKKTINGGLMKDISFKQWYKIGERMEYFRKYNRMRDKNLKEIKDQLKRAFDKTVKDGKWSEKDLQKLK